MALSDKGFVDKINSCLNRSLSAIENAQLRNASIPYNNNANKVDSVATFAALPVASENTGRMVFVVAEDVYYFSDGESWTKDLSSIPITQLYAWGSNSGGRLGDNTTVDKSSPVSVVGGFTDWCQVSSGGSHTAAVRLNGTLWTWGLSDLGDGEWSGVLGNGSISDRSSPVSVVGGFTDWCQVSAGNRHTAAVRTNGTLWTWGRGTDGRLGDFTIVDKCSPVSVVGGFTDWCQVSAGNQHTAAVRQNGTLWTWGDGGNGRLGDCTAVDKSSPISVIGGFTDWCQVSAGNEHTAAVRANGTIWTWGFGNNGRLGDGTTVTKCSPVSVVGGFTDWCQVSAGGHTVAVRTNGTLWAWGLNTCGRLGDGTTVQKCSPIQVLGGFTDWCQVSAGGQRTAAVRQNGTLWTWGDGGNGRLGDCTAVDKSSPISVIGGFTDWCQVSAGENHTVGISLQRGGF